MHGRTKMRARKAASRAHNTQKTANGLATAAQGPAGRQPAGWAHTGDRRFSVYLNKGGMSASAAATAPSASSTVSRSADVTVDPIVLPTQLCDYPQVCGPGRATPHRVYADQQLGMPVAIDLIHIHTRACARGKKRLSSQDMHCLNGAACRPEHVSLCHDGPLEENIVYIGYIGAAACTTGQLQKGGGHHELQNAITGVPPMLACSCCAWTSV